MDSARETDGPRFFNRTRRSGSIPMKLLRQGRVLEIPLYYAMRRSDLAREGIDNSGSWAFAEHIYRNEPSGLGRFGRWLDARLLSLPSARSFRNRYLAASEQLARFLTGADGRPVDVMSAPCGIPSELVRGAALVRSQTNSEGQPGRDPIECVTFHGLDLDSAVLTRARVLAQQHGLRFMAHEGDAFMRSSYPPAVDFITCTGFGEFLDDERLERLYTLFHDVLRPSGWLVTSAMKRYWASAYLLRLAELETHYRTGTELATIARRAGFRDVEVISDTVGLQSILTAHR
jgi:Putative methyltransferase